MSRSSQLSPSSSCSLLGHRGQTRASTKCSAYINQSATQVHLICSGCECILRCPPAFTRGAEQLTCPVLAMQHATLCESDANQHKPRAPQTHCRYRLLLYSPLCVARLPVRQALPLPAGGRPSEGRRLIDWWERLKRPIHNAVLPRVAQCSRIQAGPGRGNAHRIRHAFII